MVRNNSVGRKVIAAAVCAAMVFTVVFTFSPLQADAATTPKTITVAGIGTVQYAVLSDSDIIHDETGEWYHYQSGGKDFRLMSNGKDIAYYVESYPGLPERNAANDPVEKSNGLGFKLYGTSKMSYLDFWRNEGLTAKTVTDKSSNVKDPEGYYDLGGFDTVVRASLSYGMGHTAYSYENILYGYKAVQTGTSDSGAPVYSYAEDAKGDPIPAGPFAPAFIATGFASQGYKSLGTPTFRKGEATGTTGSGHANAEDFFIDPDGDGPQAEEAYKLDSYNVTGFSNMPVSVNAVDYVENMILKDIGETVPAAFTNIKVGGGLLNLWDDTDATGAAQKTVTVGANTGLLKHIDKNGEYGKAAAGKNEMTTYTIGSDGGWDTVGDDYDSSWGDYYDAWVTFQSGGSAATQAQYNNFVYNYIGAKYEYYGDVGDIAGISKKEDIMDIAALNKLNLSVKATYGTTHAADAWWRPSNKAPRLELGFNFDSIRLGGDGTDTSNGGVYQQGSAKDKAGFYKVTLYALGHANIEKLVYVPARYFLLSKDNVSIAKGASQTLTTDSKNLVIVGETGKETITWKSSNTQVATVDANGKVTGIAPGTATITAVNTVTEMTTPRGGGDPVETVQGTFEATSKVTVTNSAATGTNGWTKNAGGQWTYLKNGVAQTGWQQISKKWYYFGSDGVMKTGWQKSGSKWYYLDGSGAMKTGWLKSGGKYYYLDGSGVMKTGWLKSGGKYYYLDSSGAMATGWKKVGTKWYYLNASGAMLTGTQKIGGKTYKFNSSGAWI
ncbi:MAG: Ig-like domain-containing protein [Clostridiales Family XIII bacterium]|jgi:glucan-binding YG repeat protein|nr:Ig-like domain-containing protein [Clostridiales Family XIII bacterium]